jgi:hypothetical protein
LWSSLKSTSLATAGVGVVADVAAADVAAVTGDTFKELVVNPGVRYFIRFCPILLILLIDL